MSKIGDRAEILIEDTRVRLYTHWQGPKAPERLAKALSHKARWNDPAYLARIIFEEMLEHAPRDYTGFGISDSHVVGAKVIEVDCQNREVTYRHKEYSFSEFVERINENSGSSQRVRIQ